MTGLSSFARFALPLCLFAACAFPAGSAHAARPTEAEIQARIDAELKAMETQAKEAPAPVQQPASTPQAATEAAGDTKAPEAVPAKVYKTVPVVLTTSMGAITIAVEVERAPLTAANFLKYVDQKRLDGTSFYRGFTFPERPDIGLIQGGTQNDPKRTLKPVPHEPTTQTGLTHDDGAVSLARGAPGTATGDFFIIIGGMKGLDADPGAAGDNQGFAVFGHVIAGMDVVRAIAVAPRSPTKGLGAMKGQMLEPPIKILTARRAPAD